jgi:ABC-2 type transport system permease protein
VIRALADAGRMELRRMATLRGTYLVIAAAVSGGVFAALMTALMAPGNTALTPGRTVSALTAWGETLPMLPVGGLLAVLAALSVGQDYRYRLLPALLTAMPRRGVLVSARLIVLGVVAFGVALVTSVLGAMVCRVLGRAPALERGTLRVVGTYLVLAVLWAWLGAGLAWIVRSGAGAVTILLLGPLLIEPLILAVASDGSAELRHALSRMPFNAAWHALGPLRGTATTIGALEAGAEFTAVTLAVVAVGTLLVRRRGA